MGEAAGTAAAIAVEHSVDVRHVDHWTLQKRLIEQGVALPPETGQTNAVTN